MNAFFKELRDGRVYRTAASYAVASWLVLQLAAIVGPALGLPAWTLAATIGVLVCGFTAALWIGWMRHHRRARAEDSIPGALPRRRHHFAFALLSGLPALAVVIGFVALHRLRPADAAPATAAVDVASPAALPAFAVTEKSIAVLPFDSLSDDKANAYFAEGIQDEILTDLAKVADLKVISRTSVMSYGPGHTGNVRAIGLALGVAHLLEGSVQRAGNKIRVTAQLIDARTDAHLWAEHFDRDLADVFAIQSEMAEAIATQLRARLSPVEKAAIDARPTADLPAYELYLQAKELVTGYQSTADWRATLLRAVQLLDGAIARDGAFALAHCLAARAHDQLYFLGLDPTPARLDLEVQATATALRLQPDLGEAHLARAMLLYHGLRDYEGTRRQLGFAREALPNDPDVFSLTAYLARREGRWPDALASQERAVALDPRNPTILNDLIITYDMLRRYRDEVRTTDAAIDAVPASADYFRVLKAAALLEAGQTGAARAQFDALTPGYDPNGSTTGLRVCAALYDKRPTEAAAVLAAFRGAEYPGVNGVITPREWLEALVARAAGDGGRAQAALQKARAVAAVNVRQRPEDPNALALLGQIDAALGRKEDALDEGRRAVAMRPVAADAMDGPGLATALVLIQMWTGDTDAAMDGLGALESTPGGPDYGSLRADPQWDPIRGKTGFPAMLARLDPHLTP